MATSFVSQVAVELVCRLADDRWPVRDAACCAIGFVVSAFPAIAVAAIDDVEGRLLHMLLDKQLVDCIGSVRENAAKSIAKIASCRPGASKLSQLALNKAVAFIQSRLLVPISVNSNPNSLVTAGDGSLVKSFLPISMLKTAPLTDDGHPSTYKVDIFSH